MNIALSDLYPPIISKVIAKIRNRKKVKYPFNYVPLSVCPKLIVDVGANRGDVAFAALCSYPKARIVCFEPVKSTYAQLSNRLTHFSERVTFYNAALSDKEGQAEINITTFDGANSIEEQASFHKNINPQVKEVGKEKIKLLKLDDLFPTFSEQRIDILKIDVEGHELKVLNGGERTIKNNVDTILIEAALQRDTSWEEQNFMKIFTVLENWGFRLVNIYDVCNSTNDKVERDMLLTQFDCVFRHKRYFAKPGNNINK